jgi:hypothetical protein
MKIQNGTNQKKQSYVMHAHINNEALIKSFKKNRKPLS